MGKRINGQASCAFQRAIIAKRDNLLILKDSSATINQCQANLQLLKFTIHLHTTNLFDGDSFIHYHVQLKVDS